MSASLMTWYSRICGATLARAHARSGDRIATAAYLGQNERDYLALVEAVKVGPTQCPDRALDAIDQRSIIFCMASG